jgi:hypothetical protein
MPEFLDRFCGFQGYVAIILHLGATVAIVVAFVAWVTLWKSHFTNPVHLNLAVVASCVAAILALATYVLWVGAFTNDATTQGESAHCTIASVVPLVLAAVAVKRIAPSSDLPVSASEPLVGR